MSGQPWPVVGAFTSNGDTHESEVLTDAETVLSALRRTMYQSVTVLLTSPDAFPAFKRALTTNPQLSVEVRPEPESARRPGGGNIIYPQYAKIRYVMGRAT